MLECSPRPQRDSGIGNSASSAFDQTSALLSNLTFRSAIKEEPSLRVLAKCLRASSAKSFARAVILLWLMAHTSLVSIIHHHPGAAAVVPGAEFRVEASQGHDSNGTSGTRRDGCCLSCCLQRNCVTSVRPISIPPDLSPEPVTLEMFISEPCSNGVTLVLSNRAPPSLV